MAFDIVARREDERYILKILFNIDTFRASSAIELIRVSKITESVPVVLGERTGNGPLERGVVYYRHTLPIMNLDTFQDYVDGERPYIFSGPGGYYVSIDGQRMKEVRERLRYSIGYISNKIGVSRRSVSLYENGNAATIEIFRKIEEVLKEDLKRRIDLREAMEGVSIPDPEAPEDELVGEVIEILSMMGLHSEVVKRSPFDAISLETYSRMLFLGVVEDMSRAARAAAIKSICDVLLQTPLVVSERDTDKETIGGCPVIPVGLLRATRDQDDLIRTIEKRAAGHS
ncbi:hypothetical protein GCM10007108_01920 [Thermogymnomonas acidicola]|uniref:Putative HTH-type transcriptional regulatory protein GCM10007108_01920 n=1 Tax=Thermogymnomonas acidicola TaxID=399579 RepID=A0AA37F9A0_9ARCH|nr:hypothetical protein GCM10007108_01920 [Thermogymnomonas acidicola]